MDTKYKKYIQIPDVKYTGKLKIMNSRKQPQQQLQQLVVSERARPGDTSAIIAEFIVSNLLST